MLPAVALHGWAQVLPTPSEAWLQMTDVAAGPQLEEGKAFVDRKPS